jgi:DNA polymerase-4/DNA polymerase V
MPSDHQTQPPQPLNLHGFPQAILHLDADAFFTSVEQALNPELRGRPVVTGVERGIIACASYEAKALGIARGLPLQEARRICPDLVVLPDDYETYSLLSKRMFQIVRRFTPAVEEYSIDEAFADLTGLRGVFRAPYEAIGRLIQDAIQQDLGISVSVGISLSRTLAKLCSKFRKPHGLTAVRGSHIHLLLARTPIDKVWGIGPNSAALLRKTGVETAYDFVRRPEAWVTRLLHKPGRTTWFELQGHAIVPVNPTPRSDYGSVMKSHTFSPPTADRDLVYAELVRNAAAAFAKLRRLRLRTRRVAVALRRADFSHDAAEAALDTATNVEAEILETLRGLFARSFAAGTPYRATLVALGPLEADGPEQPDLFADSARQEARRSLAQSMDAINRRYGRGTLAAGTRLDLDRKPAAPRDARPERLIRRMPGETDRRRLAIPRFSEIHV